MERPEPAGASSSPSGKLRIVSISRTGTIGEHLKILLADGSSFLVAQWALAEGGLRAAALPPESELEEPVVVRLRAGAESTAVHERALRLLAASSQTSAGLRRKLLVRGCSPRAVEAELGRLAAQGLLDDQAFAEGWVRQRLDRPPEGAGPLAAGLERRGIPRELAEQVVRSQLTGEAERESALALLRKLERRSGMTPERLAALLLRRGFRRALVRELLEG